MKANKEEQTINNTTLPKLSEIPASTLTFIKEQTFEINSFKDLSNLKNISLELDTKCSHLETHLKNLHTKLGTLLVSWVSLSVRAKSSLEDFAFNLEDLSLICSHYGNRTQGGRRIEKIVAKDLPSIVKELRHIENLREYAVVALKLETLVGDLEDAVSSALNRHSGNMFSRTDSSAIPGALNAKLQNVHRAVNATKHIEEVLVSIQEIHPQWSNLLKAVDVRVDRNLGVLRPQVLADHRSLLAALGWPPKQLMSNDQNGEATRIPNPLVLMVGEKKQSYTESFLALCALQHVQLQRDKRQNLVFGKKDENFGLWAIEELVFPIASRIEHHLLKWTDQPEFIFALVYKVTRDFIEGVDDVLQPLIDMARLTSCSAKEAWVSVMVRVLSGFLAEKMFPSLADRYRDKDTKSDAISTWLILIDHIIGFDKRMQSLLSSETYLFFAEDGTHTGFSRSMSVLSLFCERPDWLNIWAKVELKDACRKLKVELQDERAWSTDGRKGHGQKLQRENEYTLSNREDHKAPIIVEFALKIAWDMIQRCQTLPGTSRRVQFIKAAPSKFLRHFFKILLSKHKYGEPSAYDTDDSLASICQLINAAKYSEYKLSEWGDDADLLELRLVEKYAADNMSFFDEEIQSLVEMETNWLMEVITHVLHQFENLSFYYFNNLRRFDLPPLDPDEDSGREINISDDLAEALDNLRGQLLLIHENINANDFLDFWRSVAEGLDHFIFRSIWSMGLRFSDEGVNQFVADMRGLFLVFQPFCARPEAFFPCMRDLLQLLKFSNKETLELKQSLLDNLRASACLFSHGISNLSVDQARTILSYRILSV